MIEKPQSILCNSYDRESHTADDLAIVIDSVNHALLYA